MDCPKCNVSNKDERRFCAACGAELFEPCGRCEFRNVAGDRFCGRCGWHLEVTGAARLGSVVPADGTPHHLADKILKLRSVLEGERKQVTVMFCDLTNSTELAERLGPEATYHLFNRFFALALKQIHHYEGTVNQFLGDGFMALFGAPIAHEDHASRAALSALGIRETLADAEPDLALRMGINTGPVVVGKIGDNLRMDYTAVGDTTNVAARLQQMAEPGTILVSEETARSLRGVLRLKQLPAVVLKGKTRPVAVSEVLGRGRADAPSESGWNGGISGKPFFGRKMEISTLARLFERACRGRGQVVGIGGDPGVGKSRLVQEFRHVLSDEPIGYLEGRCLSYGSGMPYHAVIELVRAMAGVAHEDGPVATATKLRRAIDRVGLDSDATLPYLLRLLGIREGSESTDVITPESVKARTIAVLLDLTLAASRWRPLLIVVEDLHWIDRSSEELLTALVTKVPEARVLLVTTFRTGYVPPWAKSPDLDTLSVLPLPPEVSRDVVAALLGQSYDQTLGEEIARRAEGNPFFLEELAHAVGARGRTLDAPLPTRVQDVLMARIDRLPEDAKRLLQNAAVVGREVPLSVLERTWDETASVTPLVNELVRQDFLYLHPHPRESVVTFRHGLTQEVAYESLLAGRRRELHVRTGRALESLFTGRTEERCELLAHHFICGGESTKALEFLSQASQKAARANAVVESKDYYLQAVKLLDDLPDSLERRRARAHLLLDQAIVYFLSLDFGSYHRMLRDHEALMLSLGDEVLLGRFYTRLGHYEWVLGRFSESLELARKGAVFCEQAGDWQNAAYAHMLSQWALLFMGEYGEAIAVEARARHAIERSFNLRWYVWSLSASAFAYMWQGRWALAIEKGKDIVAAADRMSDDSMLSYSALILSIVFRYQGDLDQALAMGELAARRAPTPADQLMTQSGLAWVKCHRGEGTAQLGALKLLVGTMQTINFRANFYTLLLSEALVVSGAREEAGVVLERLIQSARQVGMRLELGPALRLMGELLLQSEDNPQQEVAAEQLLLESATLLEEMGAEDALARARAALGRLRCRQGRIDEGRALLEGALATFERLGSLGEPERLRETLALLPRPVAIDARPALATIRAEN